MTPGEHGQACCSSAHVLYACADGSGSASSSSNGSAVMVEKVLLNALLDKHVCHVLPCRGVGVSCRAVPCRAVLRRLPRAWVRRCVPSSPRSRRWWRCHRRSRAPWSRCVCVSLCVMTRLSCWHVKVSPPQQFPLFFLCVFNLEYSATHPAVCCVTCVKSQLCLEHLPFPPMHDVCAVVTVHALLSAGAGPG